MSDEEDEDIEIAGISNMRSRLPELEDRPQDIKAVLEKEARGKRHTVSTSLDEDDDDDDDDVDDDVNSTPERINSASDAAHLQHLATSPVDVTAVRVPPSPSSDRASLYRQSSDVKKKKKNRSDHMTVATVPDDTDDLTDHEHEEDLSLYENKSGLAEDMKFLASMPELCDVTFLVGETREPVCAVRAILASRSRVFHKLLYQASHQGLSAPATSANAASSGSSRESSHDEESKSKSGRRKSRRLKDAAKDTKLKLFLKRSSEPSLDGLPFGQNQASAHQTMIIEEFEPDVFRQLIEYIHTGCVTLQARTLLGLMNAADYYGLEELRRGCTSFVACCINVDTVCALLASAERYIQYKCTKSLVQRVLEFVDQHGNEVLSLGSFALLPEHVVRLILSREELKADELSKFNAALHWSQRYCDQSPGSCDLREVISNFYECIEFYKIPAAVLMRDLHPLGVVPYDVLMNALAFQADPNSVDRHKVESPSRFRRMTLPHSNVAAADLHRLRQSAGSQFKSERSASTSTSGYAGSSDSNHIMSLSATTATVSGRSTASTVKASTPERETSEERRRSSSAAAGEAAPAATATSATSAAAAATHTKSPKKESEKDKLARYLANSKRRASRPFRRAKTLLDSTFHAH